MSSRIEARVERVIVFDLDDTLYLERDYVASGFRAVGEWITAHYAVADFADLAMQCFAGGIRDRVFDAALAQLNIEPSPSLIAQLVQVYRAHEPEIQLARDAEAYLAKPPPGAAFALLTDGFLIAQRNKIRALGLERKGVWPLVCTDIWGREGWKPSGLGFAYLASTFEFPPEAFTYVADNPAKDFIAPHRLGWHTVQIRRPGRIRAGTEGPGEQPADRVIETLEDLGHADSSS